MSGLSALTARQNPDGGWPYGKGTSCTEPTACALLALAAAGESNTTAAARAAAWLSRCQRSDGGWAPQPGVDQSTWVTSLVLLVSPALLSVQRDKALAWLAAETGRESSWIQRARSYLLNGSAPPATETAFPWYPHTAAWVTPSCFGLLALEKANRAARSNNLDQRCTSAREYLLSHTCRDGGWNHGSTRALGYDSDSYPETTGQALLALHNASGDKVERALERARRQLESCRSLEAASWLRLGLLAHQRNVPASPVANAHGGVQELSLEVLAQAAANGRNIFVE